jgi:hypothetical protein
VDPPSRPRRAVAAARATQRRRWWATFLLVAALSSLWLLATPLFGAPDEPAHAIRAASVVRFQILGDEVRGDDRLVVQAPRAYEDASRAVSCYAYQPDVPANCASFDDHTQLAGLPTSAARHPPAYYAVAGLPTLAFRGAFGVYLMRVVSALVTAAFVATAVVTLERLRRPRLGALAILVCATPMLLFTGGTVNPSALEVSAALALWVSGTVLMMEAPSRLDPTLLRRIGIAAVAMVLSRQLAPLWLAVIAAALAVIGGRAALRALIGSRAARWWGIAVGVAFVLQCGWILYAHPLDPSLGDRSQGIRGLSVAKALQGSFGKSLDRLRQMVGWFGWLDAPSPGLTYALWTLALGIILALALLAWRRRFLAVAGGVALVAVAAPLVFETMQAHRIGYFWQGRYSMPLVLGVPVLLALSLSAEAHRGDRPPDADPVAAEPLPRGISDGHVVVPVAVAVVVAQVAAFGQALRRNTVGYHGALDFVIHPLWNPPAPPWFLILAYAVTVSAFAWWVTTSVAGPVPPDAQSEPIPSGSLRYS